MTEGITRGTDRGPWGLPVEPAMTEGYPMNSGMTAGNLFGKPLLCCLVNDRLDFIYISFNL